MLRESLMKLSLLGGSGAKERGRDRERESDGGRTILSTFCMYV